MTRESLSQQFRRAIVRGTVFLLVTLLTSVSHAQDEARAFGEPMVEPPTLHCVGLRWSIKGDANENARVAVEARKAGQTKFLPQGDLVRVFPNERLGNISLQLGVRGGWTFAGSVVGLEPGTAYEIKLSLKDPDGGDEEATLPVTTWEEPKLPKGMQAVYVTSGDEGGDGTKASPYRGLRTALAEAKPGQILLLLPGVYLRGGEPKGSAVVKTDGTLERPLVLRSVEPGKAVLDGCGDPATTGSILDMHGRKHVWLEGLKFVGRRFAIGANSSSDLVVRGCLFRDVGTGFGSYTGDAKTSQHHFIADNVFEGTTPWPPAKGAGDFGFATLSGAGHVVCHNRVSFTGDGVNGHRTDSWSGCDIYRNDFHGMSDDAVETDHSEHNVRVFENRIVDAMVGVSFDANRGGPSYCFRNVIYNTVFEPFRFHGNTTGIILYHNTSVRLGDAVLIQPGQDSIVNLRFRNNLFVGNGQTGLLVGTERCLHWDLDSDGYAGHERDLARWKGKEIYKRASDAKKGGEIYFEHGAFELPLVRVFAKKLNVPRSTDTVNDPEVLDFALHARSVAGDKGEVLPGFNDDFEGRRPDLGALERKAKAPQYGPRN